MEKHLDRVYDCLVRCIDAINRNHDEASADIEPTNIYKKGGYIHVEGLYWDAAMVIARELGTSVIIVDNHHIKIF